MDKSWVYARRPCAPTRPLWPVYPTNAYHVGETNCLRALLSILRGYHYWRPYHRIPLAAFAFEVDVFGSLLTPGPSSNDGITKQQPTEHKAARNGEKWQSIKSRDILATRYFTDAWRIADRANLFPSKYAESSVVHRTSSKPGKGGAVRYGALIHKAGIFNLSLSLLRSHVVMTLSTDYPLTWSRTNTPSDQWGGEDIILLMIITHRGLIVCPSAASFHIQFPCSGYSAWSFRPVEQNWCGPLYTHLRYVWLLRESAEPRTMDEREIDDSF